MNAWTQEQKDAERNGTEQVRPDPCEREGLAGQARIRHCCLDRHSCAVDVHFDGHFDGHFLMKLQEKGADSTFSSESQKCTANRTSVEIAPLRRHLLLKPQPFVCKLQAICQHRPINHKQRQMPCVERSYLTRRSIQCISALFTALMYC